MHLKSKSKAKGITRNLIPTIGNITYFIVRGLFQSAEAPYINCTKCINISVTSFPFRTLILYLNIISIDMHTFLRYAIIIAVAYI